MHKRDGRRLRLSKLASIPSFWGGYACLIL